RHQVLRTVYLQQGADTLQHIRLMNDIAFDIERTDLSHLSGPALGEQVRALVEADITREFNLESDLMLRVSFITKTLDTGVLIFNMHHIASDGWSLEVLTKEFFALYQAYGKKQANPLPQINIQYADYAHWQRQYLQGEVLEAQLSYWQKHLDEVPVVHSLPLDYDRAENKRHAGAMVSRTLPPATAKALLMIAKAHGLTPFMLLHGMLSLLLSRHSNSHDIVIGTPVANRLQGELEPLIGFFVNTLVLRANTNHTQLSDYFAHIRQVHLDAQSNQDVPFEQLVERLNVPRSTAHTPLFQIMMTTNNDYGIDGSEVEIFTLPNVDIGPFASGLVQEKFDLSIDLSLSEQGMGLNWTYDVSLFSEVHIEQLNRHLCRLLESLSQMPNPSFDGLEVLSEDEKHYLVTDLNVTKCHYPKDQCIHSLFEQQVLDHPQSIAVVFEDQQLNYQQLNDKANQLAHYLQAHHDIKPDTLVGLCVAHSVEMVIGMLAILKAGGAYVPLDPNYPQARMNYMLDDAALKVVLSQNEVRDS
ncbi:MAG: condensation domain-containing protein, partial [Psychrosphaera sp.]|nr:condensation domain-containing protein [Psychrosphaera sp.]